MDAHPSNFKTIIQGEKQFYVPLFQRPYTWGDVPITVMWDDITDLYEGNIPNTQDHFIGSFVTILDSSTPTGVSRYTVIDGQQRMTTLLLLLAAIREIALVREQTQTADMIQGLYLCNPYQTGDNAAKFVPTQADRTQFRDALELQNDTQVTSPALHYAFEKIRKLVGGKDNNGQPYNMARLHDLITMRLRLVSITLGSNDNAYVIFHSLNGKGEDLTEADLIRNYFFMRLPIERQQTVYDAHWFPMQEALKGKYELPEFFRHYLSKNGTQVNAKALYDEVKRRADDTCKTPDELVDFIAGIARFAGFYKRIINPDLEPSKTIRARLERLNRWGVTVAYPLLLNLYDDYAATRISETEFVSMIASIECFVVRRFFCRIPTNRLNRIFAVAYRDSAPDDDGAAAARAQTLPAFLARQQWPDDATFIEGFHRYAIYHEGARCDLVLRSLELAEGHHEVVTTDTLQIEHVMPQTLSADWKQALGPEYQRVYDEWLHTIGNLTLTGYNPTLSNSVFAQKQGIFAASNITLNAYFTGLTNWAEPEIIERGKYLAERAASIWREPGT